MRRYTGTHARAAAGIAVAIATTAAAVPTASAAVPAASSVSSGGGPSACSFTRTLCLFDGTGFTGQRLTVSSLVPGGTCVSLVDHGWAGRVRSVANTHTSSAAMFMNDDCVGGPYQVPGRSGIADLGGFSPASVWVAG
ncbi:peptidase inhibitor family I36 protein [Streptodolium elevatio]|uniref:Peptidase inhibitor family I36 protein n=1 Tax=Streptodolium elevatio TaxID=3157996 RepID=A0ABV3DU70_9ACTN